MNSTTITPTYTKNKPLSNKQSIQWHRDRLQNSDRCARELEEMAFARYERDIARAEQMKRENSFLRMQIDKAEYENRDSFDDSRYKSNLRYQFGL